MGDIDLTNNLIEVTRNWDRQHGFITPKSRSGTRRVPITPTLHRELINHRLQQGTGGQGFAFSSHRNPRRPFNPSSLTLHTKKAWKNAGLTPIGLHECRHSYAAYMIAAGINSKALSTYMGHAASPSPSTATATSFPATKHKPRDSWRLGSRKRSPQSASSEIVTLAPSKRQGMSQ